MKDKKAKDYGLTESQYKDVLDLVEHLDSLKNISQLDKEIEEAETEELKEELKKYADTQIEGALIEKAAFFTNEQVLLFKEAYKNASDATYVDTNKTDMLKNDFFVKLLKEAKSIEGFVKIFKDRKELGLTNKDFNGTVIRFVFLFAHNDRWTVELIPMTYLEAMFVNYLKYHAFIDSKNSHVKKEVRNIIRNSNLDFDNNKMKHDGKSLYDIVSELLR